MQKVLLPLAALMVCLVVQTSSAKIVHRWSFDKDSADSVGGAHATLHEGAKVREGQISFDGQNNWVELPIGKAIEKLSSATFETWFTWEEMQAPWVRIFDIGNTTRSNMFFTLNSGLAEQGAPALTPRFAITTAGRTQEQQLSDQKPLELGKPTHVAITIDAEKRVGKLYINGKEVASREMTMKPSDLGNTKENLLGASRYVENGDPLFKGSITEFRIYDHPLSADEIEQSFTAGPDKLVTKPEADAKAADGKAAAPTANEEKK